jgi:2-methylisocitrate lyase-like PEP mutase family enzyme
MFCENAFPFSLVFVIHSPTENSMSLSTQAQKAETLRNLHHGPRILILANAWDVASARIIEDLGAPAIATTSAGIAAALGYQDGEQISRDEMLEVIARIAAAVRVPVSADFEAGYSNTLEGLAESIQALVSAGAVGLNFEDVIGKSESGQVDLATQVKKIQTIRDVSKAALGVQLVMNARTDIYLLPIGPEATRFDRTVERLRAYREAGADCVFAPALKDGDTIGRLVKAIDAPLNILLMPGCPSVNEMEKLGVARVSAGSGIMRSALGHTRRVAQQLLQGDSYAAMLDGAVPFAEVMKLISRE